MDQQRSRIELKKAWQYRFPSKEEAKGLVDGIFDPGKAQKTGDWASCTVPSVWNLYDTSLIHYFGTMLFKTTFPAPAGIGNRAVYLCFAGANYNTRAWLNGTFLGVHDGGHTGFSFDISKALDVVSGEPNVLVVALDNAPEKDRLPWLRKVDFFNYGGIHRPVTLELKPKKRIEEAWLSSTIEYAADGDNVPSVLALNLALGLLGFERLEGKQCKVTLVDRATGTVLASAASDISGSVFDITIPLDPAEIRLWCPDDPALYDVVVSVDDDGKVIDACTWRWGFKKIETRGTKFYLNNKRLYLRGTNKHEDHPDFGLALPDEIRYQDLLKMKRANINCFRGSHYPVATGLLDACDELGLLFIEELSQWQLSPAHMARPSLLDVAIAQLEEMHARDRNHPCIMAWSMSNEVATDSDSGRKYHEALFARCRELEAKQGERLVTFVSNRRMVDHCFDLVDFICTNVYHGWYGNDWNDMPAQVELMKEIMIEDEDKPWGDPKPIVIAEFGAGAIPGFRSWEHNKWSEDFQADLLRFYIEWAIEHRDYIGGTWTWLFHDFRVHLSEGPANRPRSYNNKGMLSEYRVPKLGFDVVRELYGKWKALESQDE